MLVATASTSRFWVRVGSAPWGIPRSPLTASDDHAHADETQQDEGDPMVDVDDIDRHGVAGKIANQRHEGLEPAEEQAGLDRMPRAHLFEW